MSAMTHASYMYIVIFVFFLSILWTNILDSKFFLIKKS